MKNTLDKQQEKEIIKLTKINGSLYRIFYSDKTTEEREISRSEVIKTNLHLARLRKRAKNKNAPIRSLPELIATPPKVDQQEIDAKNELRHNVDGITSASAKSQTHGSANWRPANRLSIFDGDSNFAYRWIKKTPGRIKAALYEGWEFCTPEEVNAPIKGLGDPSDRFELANSVLMKLSKQKKEQRTQYYNSKIQTIDKTSMEFKAKLGIDKDTQGAYGEIKSETVII